MAVTDGLTVIGDYDQATAGAAIDALVALIPNPDAPQASTGAVAGPDETPVGAGFLDEMSPAAAAQLRVELTNMKSFINLFDAPA